MYNIKQEIIKDIHSASISIKIAVAWFTDESLIAELINVIRKKPNLNIEIILSNHKDNLKAKSEQIKLAKAGAHFFTWGSSDSVQGQFMHCKFYIIDGTIAKSGSYNWTFSAASNAECLDQVDVEEKIRLFNQLKNSSKMYIII